MFEFLMDTDNYDDRCVGRFDDEQKGTMVSTAMVSDGKEPYETAIIYPGFNDGDMMIVEAYSSKDRAKKGHSKWLKKVKSGNLPDTIEDCMNAKLCSLLDEPIVYNRATL